MKATVFRKFSQIKTQKVGTSFYSLDREVRRIILDTAYLIKLLLMSNLGTNICVCVCI